MWNRIVLLSALALGVLDPATASAQEPSRESGCLFRRTRVRLEVVGGRIAVVNRGCGQSRCTVASSPAADSRQTLSIQLQPSALVVSYESIDAGQRLALEVDEQQQLTIHRLPIDGSSLAEVRYCQAADGKLTLLVGGSKPVQYSAESLWHLMLAEPEVCREHLVPMLESLRANWRLEEQASAVVDLLLQTSSDDLLATRARWQSLIEDLKSDDFKTRHAADRALRNAGQGVVAFLKQQDPNELDAEQRGRIRAICAELCDGSCDTPQRVASWLANDKTAWLSLLGRGDVQVRIAAAEHLSTLCRVSLPFDPEANAVQREAQLQKLRARLADK